MNIEIANRLQKLRKENGYSQEELADKLGISRQAVSKWERAESSPDTDNLIVLARLYHISLDDLLNDTDEKEKENSEIEAITESKEEIKNEVSEDLDKKDIDKEEDNDMKKDENEINRNSIASFLEKSKDIKNEEDTYLTYRVYIVKEEDTVNSIKDKYNVSEEELSSYNDISNLCSGMKLVIPSND